MANSYSVDGGALNVDSGAYYLGPGETLVTSFEYTRSEFESIFPHNNGRFDLVNDRVAQGSTAIYHNRISHNETVSMPGDGLPYYPQVGDRFAFRPQVDNDGERAYAGLFHSGYDSARYELSLNSDLNRTELWANYSGGRDLLTSLSHTVNLDEYYDLVLDTNEQSDGDYELTIETYRSDGTHVGTKSTVDSTYTYSGRGIGFGAYGYGYMDYARVL